MKTSEWIMLISLSLLWGGSFFFNEIALRELPVLTLVAIRVTVAALVLWVVAFASGYSLPRNAQLWRWFLVMGLLNNVLPFSLIVFGQTEITAGLASILNATTPFFIVIVIALFARNESVGANKIAGLVVGFFGVALMMSPDIMANQNSNLLGQVAVLLAAFSYALAGLYGRRFHAAGVAPLVAAAGQVTMSAVLLLPVALFLNGSALIFEINMESWLAVSGLAILSTAVAYVLYFRILSSAGAINLMLVTFLMPVTALLLGTFLLNEVVKPLEMAGMVIIALALIVIDGRVLARLRR